MLTCLVSEESARTALENHSKLTKKDVYASVPPSITEDCVSVHSVKECFTPAAWREVLQKVDAVRQKPIWHCGRCGDEIEDECENCVFCDRCLIWLHYRCTKPKPKKAPASEYWFCSNCKGTKG